MNQMMQGGPPRQAAVKCSQCGLLHPPLEEGAICTMVQEKGGLDLTTFFSQLTNICKHQVETKELKDHKKLFSYIIVEVAKALESYKE